MPSEIIKYITGSISPPPQEAYTHGTTTIDNPTHARSLTERDQVEAHYVTTRVTSDGSIVTIATPEARAMYVGLIGLDGNELAVIPSRLHLGALREMDGQVAIYHLLKVLSQLSTSSFLEPPYDKTGAIGILRASEALSPRTSLYEALGSCIPYDMVNANHIEADNPIGRDVEIAEFKLEGFPPEITRLIIVDDGIAGGITQGGVLEHVLERRSKIDSVIILTHYAALRGSIPVINYCNVKGIRVVIGCVGATLDSYPPELYYSPLPCDQPHRWADERDIELYTSIMKDMRPCAGGNWTANFLAPETALEDFKKYLDTHGIPIDSLRGRVTIDDIRSIYPDISDVLPYSTYWQAERFGETELLNALL